MKKRHEDGKSAPNCLPYCNVSTLKFCRTARSILRNFLWNKNIDMDFPPCYTVCNKAGFPDGSFYEIEGGHL